MLQPRLCRPSRTIDPSLSSLTASITALTLSSSKQPTTFVRNASHATQGRANGPKDSAGRRLGAKKSASEYVIPGNIIFRQRGIDQPSLSFQTSAVSKNDRYEMASRRERRHRKGSYHLCHSFGLRQLLPRSCSTSQTPFHRSCARTRRTWIDPPHTTQCCHATTVRHVCDANPKDSWSR
jgi:Ribosomal L27 protein